jgi:predicted DNA-binding transcriptional regulator AlpA
LTAPQAAAVLGCSERQFHKLRALGRVPAPVALGTRAVRWVRHEVEAAAAALPRVETPAPQPPQLLRGKVERLKRIGTLAEPAK